MANVEEEGQPPPPGGTPSQRLQDHVRAFDALLKQRCATTTQGLSLLSRSLSILDVQWLWQGGLKVSALVCNEGANPIRGYQQNDACHLCYDWL